MALKLRSNTKDEDPKDPTETTAAPASKKKGRKKKAAKKTAVPEEANTHTFAEKDGASIEDETTSKPVSFAGPVANVNVNMGTRQGLANYSDVRYGCSITIPCEPTDPAIEAAYQKGEAWCREKMDALDDQIQEMLADGDNA